MSKLHSLIIVLLFSYISISKASMYPYIPIPQMIKGTDIIFIGKLIETYEKKEFYGSESSGVIYTTYVFSVIELLKGKYNSDIIKVKKLGGCDYQANICVESSFAGYSYTESSKALMFVDFNQHTNSYRSYRGGTTAYSIQGSLELIASGIDVNYIKLKQENGEFKDEVFTLKILRGFIDDITNK